jgi:hypothetical protein
MACKECVFRVDTLLLGNVVPILERTVGDTVMIAKAGNLEKDVTARTPRD